MSSGMIKFATCIKSSDDMFLVNLWLSKDAK